MSTSLRYLLLGLVGLAMVLAAACGSEEPGSRVVVLGLDGLDPEAVDLLMSEGKLPNLAKIRQEGAYGRLQSQEPLLSPIIWTTIATGKTADQHGIVGFATQGGETDERLPVRSDMRRAEALWNIFSDAGREVAVVGWWATWPPEPVEGVVVSDRTAYHFLFGQSFSEEEAGEAKTYPPGLLEEVEPLLVRPDDLTIEDVEEFVSVSPEELERPFDFADDLAHFKWALATARSYRDIGLELWRERRPDLEMVYIEGTDSSAHLFGHLFRVEGLAGELAEQQGRYGETVERMYELGDAIVGEFLAAMDDDTTLLVLSDHGFRLGELHDDPSQTRDMRRVSERFHREHGVLYMYGDRVKAGARLERATILDIAPTVLALAGLPAAEDMPGRVLVEGLAMEEPPERVATYEEEGGGEAVAAGGASEADRKMIEHLESLGYLGGAETEAEAGGPEIEPQGRVSQAAILFQAKRYDEAAALYRELIEAAPEDAALHASLAGALGAIGRYEEARVALERSLELDPLQVEAHHNLGAVHERLGNREQAIEAYKKALSYDSTYAPSRDALIRLTGTSRVREPATAEERRAMALAEQAGQLARRGAYEEAWGLLDQAVEAAPEFALIYQYRSNVAYLMGDAEAAIEALERGLELEPDNELFKQNLEQLEARREQAGQPQSR